MPSRSEIMRALQGALLLVRGDQAGYRLFDNTMEGFWRSFSALVLIVPMAMIAVPAELGIYADIGQPAREADGGFVAMRLFSLAIEWIAYPIVMVPVARLLMLGGRYAPYIIAYNWSSVVVFAVLFVPFVLFLAGLISGGLAVILNLAATMWALYFRFWVARTALETTVTTAIGLAVLDLLLSLTIIMGVDELVG